MESGEGDDGMLRANERIKELERTVAALQEKIKVIHPLPKGSGFKDEGLKASIEVPGEVTGVKNCHNNVWERSSEPLTSDNTGYGVEVGKSFNEKADDRLSTTHLSGYLHIKEDGLGITPQESCGAQNDPASGTQLGLQRHFSPLAIEGGSIRSQVGQVSMKVKKGQYQEPEQRHLDLRGRGLNIMSDSNEWNASLVVTSMELDSVVNVEMVQPVDLCKISYHGFASQGASQKTVEAELFAALEHTKLLIVDRAEAKYSRCGRTDKGVSAIGQLIALELRSKLKTPVQESGHVDHKNYPAVLDSEGFNRDRVAAARASRDFEEAFSSSIGAEDEIDYVGVLNRVLPKDIRVLGWCTVPRDFNARFSCLYREYKYFFINEDLDLDAMKVAGSKFLGEHDFRNFCKMDAANVHNYRRTISMFEILPANESWAGRQVWMMRVRGTAFLWHQIRCMAAVLFMVGQRDESPMIVEELLNVGKVTRKPQYTMASELPLVLHTCGFQGLTLHCPSRAAKHLQIHLKNIMEETAVQLALLQEAMSELPTSELKKDSTLKKQHAPLLGRLTEPSYEERRKKILVPM